MHKWIPATVIMGLLISQLWAFLTFFFNLVADSVHQSSLSYVALLMMIYIIQQLPPSFEENVKNFIERFKFAISNFHVFPQLLGSPAFIMRNGFCFQRGAKYLIDTKSMIGGSTKQKSCEKILFKKEDNIDTKNDENLVTNKDWKWPCWKREKENIKKFDPYSNKMLKDAFSPFEVIYGASYNESKNIDLNILIQYIPTDVYVKLNSKYLQDIIKELLPSKFKPFKDHGEIQAEDLFLLYINGNLEKKDTELGTDHATISNDGGEENDLHMFHLKRFLEGQYESVIQQYHRMVKARIISWDMLWTLIVPGIDVIYYCPVSKEELCGKVLSTSYSLRWRSSADRSEFNIELEVYDYNCKSFTTMKTQHQIKPFDIEVKITNLSVWPLQFKTNFHESEEYFYQRGRTFSDLVLKCDHCLMHYEGLIFEPPLFIGWRRKIYAIKGSMKGRVMIDQKWYAKMKPNRDMGTAQTSKLLQTKGWSDDNDTRMKALANEFESVLKYAPAVVYGYSFSIRKWGCFCIAGFSKIHFTSTAFDKLVMKEDIKSILFTLTEFYIKDVKDFNYVPINADLLQNKGEGCIIVLHGPPGTGKTLTVESIAEKLECPLWQLSVSKLTASTKHLENKMLRTFEIAKAWKAILVLDEADVYLSSRKYSPLSSDNTSNNALTGVFLRVLEYYKGVLFLTTNVMTHIEPAIFSRMSLFIKYEEFNIEERKRIWNNFLEEIKISNLSEEFWRKVLSQVNGRVIRNIIQNAQILSKSKNFSMLNAEECLLKAFDAMTNSATLNYLIESHDQSSIEAAPSAPTHSSLSAPSAPTHSSLSDLIPTEY